MKGFVKTPAGRIALEKINRFVVIDSPGWGDHHRVRVYLDGGDSHGLNTEMFESEFLKAVEEARDGD